MKPQPKILVFLHGTTLMHASAVGRTRQQRVQQIIDGDESARDFGSYVPTEASVSRLLAWSAQGAQIIYMSSHRKPSAVELDQAVLKRHGFPEGPVFHRGPTGTYTEVVSEILPDVLIEDDCESFGGRPRMVYPALPPGMQRHIRSIVVQEFGGLADLPDDLSALLQS
jgi:hypothetical protein